MADTFTRPAAAAVNTETITFTVAAYVDAANDQTILDTFATVNAVVHLFERRVVKRTYPLAPGKNYQGFLTTAQRYYYPAATAAYVPTNLTTATTAPYTIAGGTQLAEGEVIDLDALYTLWGDVRS
jgi:hypothetical protein